MRNERKVWHLMNETSGSIFPLAQAIMGETFAKHFTDQRFYPFTFTAAQLAPKSYTADLLHRRNPYNNPSSIKSLLAEIAAAGYIDSDGKGGYTASEKGKVAVQTVHQVFYEYINNVNLLPAAKLKELAALLEKLVISCVKTNISNDHLNLDISHNGHPAVESGSLARVDQYLDDMNAFRDDAHISAWTPVGVDGHTWEVLTLVWNGEANTAKKLIERLPYRTYLAEDYTATLNELTKRGRIEPWDDGYRVTDQGKHIRDEAESQTDVKYFAPWKVLKDNELNRLGELLQELKETNLKIAEENKGL